VVRSVKSVTLCLGRESGRFSLGACGFGLAFDASVDDGTGKGWGTDWGSMLCMYVQHATLVQVCTAWFWGALIVLGMVQLDMTRRQGRKLKLGAWRGCRRGV
jgi:hypothetical protein